MKKIFFITLFAAVILLGTHTANTAFAAVCDPIAASTLGSFFGCEAESLDFQDECSAIGGFTQPTGISPVARSGWLSREGSRCGDDILVKLTCKCLAGSTPPGTPTPAPAPTPTPTPAPTSGATSDTGNPVGVVESATCSSVSGWSYDPTFSPTIIYGCSDLTATNYNPSATNDDGSCIYPQAICISRYRWVNVAVPGRADQSQGCAAAGAAPVAPNPAVFSDRGICASGEDRPASGYDVALINYSRGVWGETNLGGTIVKNQNGKHGPEYRCYRSGQKQDADNTDVAVAYYCDFGNSFPESCPADFPPPRVFYGGGGGSFFRTELFFRPNIFMEKLAELFRPLIAFAASSDSNSVLVYDGPIDTGNLLETVPANIPRSDVNAIMGISGNHGFVWTTPKSLSDGVAHTLYFYGTNTDTAGKISELNGTPATIICAAGPNSAPSAPTLSCPPNASTAGVSLNVSFLSTDPENNQIKYLIDWDNTGTIDQTVPDGSFVASGLSQSASRIFATPGQKTVGVFAQDDQGNLSPKSTCSFLLVDAVATVPCTTNCDAGNNGVVNGVVNDVGSGGVNGASGNGAQVSSFTVSGDSKVAIQFIGGLGATSQPSRMTVNPVSGFSAPVTLSVESVKSGRGTDLPPDVTATYFFDGQPSSIVSMVYNSTFGQYMNPLGTIGSIFTVKLSKKITEPYFVTLVGKSGAISAPFVIQIVPNPINPDFKEI